MRRAWQGALAGLWVPAALAAQVMPPQARPQLGCAAYDSLMQGAPRRDPGAVAVQRVRGGLFISLGGPATVSSLDRGITGVGLIIRGDSAATPATAAIQINANLVEPTGRPIDDRQGRLILDDSTMIDLGSMGQTAGDPFPDGTKTWYLYAPVPPGSLVPLARARRVIFKAGGTAWDFPERMLRDLRGALAAVACR